MKTRLLVGKTHNKIMHVGSILYYGSSNIFSFMIMLDGGGFLKDFFLANLVTSTPSHYLESRLEILIVPQGPHASMAGSIADDSWNTSMSPNYQIL